MARVIHLDTQGLAAVLDSRTVEDLRVVLEQAGVKHATPVARAFLAGLAVLIGVDGLHAFVDDVLADGRGLDDIVAEIHSKWANRRGEHASEGARTTAT